MKDININYKGLSFEEKIKLKMYYLYSLPNCKEKESILNTLNWVLDILEEVMKQSVMLYKVDEIDKTIGQINNQIESFRGLYKKKPTFIIISLELEILLRKQHDLMSQHEAIILNGEYLKVNRIFGMTCFTSPALKDLEFEIR